MLEEGLITILGIIFAIVLFTLVTIRLLVMFGFVALTELYIWLHYHKIKFIAPSLTLASILGTMFLLI